MSIVYVSDKAAKVWIQGNRFEVRLKDEDIHSYPIETIEAISLLSGTQLTTGCVEECLKRGISVSYMSRGGKYFGRLVSTGHVNAERQRKQSELYCRDFAIGNTGRSQVKVWGEDAYKTQEDVILI